MEKIVSVVAGIISICCVAFSIGMYLSVKNADTNQLRNQIMTIEKSVTDFKNQYLELPIGSIVAWNPILKDKNGNQTYRNLPDGWSICNGLNGTPNLTEKFLMGVVDVKKSGDLGGSNTIAESGSHTHRYTIAKGGGTRTPVGFQSQGGQCETANHNTGAAGNHSHGDNRPAYYSAIYIMKLK